MVVNVWIPRLLLEPEKMIKPKSPKGELCMAGLSRLECEPCIGFRLEVLLAYDVRHGKMENT
jgi:hypothetical protein